jgi:hypothetical protein
MPVHEVFLAAEKLGPVPYNADDATPQAWLRHYIATALAAHTAFYAALPPPRTVPADQVGSKPELGYLMMIATSATAAAQAIDAVIAGDVTADKVAAAIWKLTPNCGALNSEYVGWLMERADQLGINPADLDFRLNAADFRSTSRYVWATPDSSDRMGTEDATAN